MAIAPLAAASLRVGPHGLAVSEQLVLASLRAWARARMAGDDPRELVRPGETGLLVPPGASSPLAAALERLAGDAALRARMGAAGRDRALGRFTEAEVVGRTLDLLGL